MIRLALLLSMLFPALVNAEEIVAGLSQRRVSITANFDGSEILIFGAIKREAPSPGPLDVIITVEGPSRSEIVRRKGRVFGVWANVDSVTIDRAPSLYAVATSGPIAEILSATDDLRYRINLDHVVRMVGIPAEIAQPAEYKAALMRIREREGEYFLREGIIDIEDETLFNTRIRLPASLTEGSYRTRVFLLRGRETIDVFETEIGVGKVGLERAIFNLAHERPLLYGILSVIVALGAGWIASEVFRRLRR